MSFLTRLLGISHSETKGLAEARKELEISQNNLEVVQGKNDRIDDVTKSLLRKHFKDGWGEVIAETMKRSSR